MRLRRGLVAAVVLAGCLWSLPGGAAAMRHGAEHGEDRAGVFRTLVVEPGETVGDVACVFCTVEVRGTVSGDLAALFSTVRVEDGQEIRGDVAGLFSTLRLEDGASVGGDLAWVLGSSTMGDGAVVHGDRAVLGSGVSWLVMVAPLLIVIGVVWLLVSLVRRVV